MTNTITLKELRPALPRVISRMDSRFDRFVVTRRGRPVAVMLSAQDYDSLMETIDILADSRAMAGLRKGEEDMRRGRKRPWREIKRSLGVV